MRFRVIVVVVVEKQRFNISFCVLNYACQCQQNKNIGNAATKLNRALPLYYWNELCFQQHGTSALPWKHSNGYLFALFWGYKIFITAVNNVNVLSFVWNARLFFPILDKFRFSRRSSIKDSNINNHENISRWRLVDKAYRRIDEQTRRNYQMRRRLDHSVLLSLLYLVTIIQPICCHYSYCFIRGNNDNRHHAVIRKLSSLFSI